MNFISNPKLYFMDGHDHRDYTVEEALSAVGFGKFQKSMLFYAGLGYIADASELMLLSFIGPALQTQWALSSAQQSLLSAVVFGGMLVGAHLWGLLSDSLGRRRALLGIALLICVAGFLSALSPNYATLLALRCAVGFGLGGGSVFSCWFLELVGVANRGKWMVVFAAFWSAGTILEAGVAWMVMPVLNWRWLLAITSLPSLALLFFYPFIPESPRYLCAKNRTGDAQDLLQKIASINQVKLPCGGLVPMVPQEQEHQEHQQHSCCFDSKRSPLLISNEEPQESSYSYWWSFSMRFSSKLIRTTLLLWVLYFGNSFSYYGIILLTPQLSVLQTDTSNLYFDVLVTSLAELPGILLSALTVDMLGRKLSMVFMFLLACLFLFPLAFHLLHHQSTTPTLALLFGARMCLTGTFSVACIYGPELYPTSVRASGAGVASAVGRIGGIVCPLVAVGLVTASHQTAAILLFEIVLLLTALSLLFFQLETKGQPLNDTLSA